MSSEISNPASPVEERSRSESSSAPSHRSGTPPAIDDHIDGTKSHGNDSDSERSHASPEPGRRRLVDSDSDEDLLPKTSTNKDTNVFGDDVSTDSDNAEGDVRRGRVDSDEEAGNRTPKSDSDSAQEGKEEFEQEDVLQPEIITADVPDVNFAMGDELYHVRMPNFLSIEIKPFVPEEYEDIYDENDLMDEEGRNRLKLRVENTLRWRNVGTEEDPKFESNAKIVKWSDGTMSLMVGSEIFECHNTRLLAPTHLYIRQAHGLAGKAIFDKRMKFRPATTESKTHKKVTMNMADRTKKSGQVQFIQDVGVNPDEAKKEIVRKEEEALRAAYRRERDMTTSRRGRDYNRGRISSGFLERGDYSDDESPGQRTNLRKEAPLIGPSSDESEDDAKKIEKSKEDTSDSDEEFHRNRQERKKRIVSSDEESD